MTDYIFPDTFRKPLLDLNRRYYPACSHLTDDEFEQFLLTVSKIDQEEEEEAEA